MKNAVIITGPGFEDSEVIYPFYRLQEAGFTVDVVTTNDKTVNGKHGNPAIPTMTITELDPDRFDMLVVPGGYEAPDRARQISGVLQFTRAMFERGKVVTSICHGPWVLVSAGILKGRKATSYKGCKDDVINAGATYLDQAVVVDGHLVTAQRYQDNAAWMAETLRVFAQVQQASATPASATA